MPRVNSLEMTDSGNGFSTQKNRLFVRQRTDASERQSFWGTFFERRTELLALPLSVRVIRFFVFITASLLIADFLLVLFLHPR